MTTGKRRKSIWARGYDWICRLSKTGSYEYSITECRIAAMAYEAGYRAGKRDKKEKV